MSLQTKTRRHPLLLPLLAFCQFLLAVDYNIVLVALPDIGTDLDMTETSLQWVVSSYALAFGGLLLLGGRLADVFGGAGSSFWAWPFSRPDPWRRDSLRTHPS